MEILKSLLKFIVTLLCGCYIATYGIGLFFIASKFMAYSWWWLLLFIPIAVFITITLFLDSLTFISLSLNNNLQKIWQLLDSKPSYWMYIFFRRITHGFVYANGIIFLFIFPLDAITTSIGQGFGYYLGAVITFFLITFWIRNTLWK